MVTKKRRTKNQGKQPSNVMSPPEVRSIATNVVTFFFMVHRVLEGLKEEDEPEVIAFVRQRLTDGEWISQSIRALRDLYDHADAYAALHTAPVQVLGLPEQSAVHGMSILCQILLEREALCDDADFLRGLRSMKSRLEENDRLLKVRVRVLQETARVMMNEPRGLRRGAVQDPIRLRTIESRRMDVLRALPASDKGALKGLADLVDRLVRRRSNPGCVHDTAIGQFENNWSADTFGRDVSALRGRGLVDPGRLRRTPKGDRAATGGVDKRGA